MCKFLPCCCQVGPNGEPLTGEGPKSPRNKSGAKRRRNGRWSQEETNTLIGLVRQWGKGKWKKILEEGGPSFKNRSQARAPPFGNACCPLCIDFSPAFVTESGHPLSAVMS